MRWRTTTRTMTTLKGISALGIDRDLGFSQAQQGHRPHDDGDNEEDDNEVNDNYEVDDNDKDDNNNKDGNNNKDDKGVSALGLDRDLGFFVFVMKSFKCL